MEKLDKGFYTMKVHHGFPAVATFERGDWRNWLCRNIGGDAPSPAHFYRLPQSRVVELGTQAAI